MFYTSAKLKLFFFHLPFTSLFCLRWETVDQYKFESEYGSFSCFLTSFSLTLFLKSSRRGQQQPKHIRFTNKQILDDILLNFWHLPIKPDAASLSIHIVKKGKKKIQEPESSNCWANVFQLGDTMFTLSVLSGMVSICINPLTSEYLTTTISEVYLILDLLLLLHLNKCNFRSWPIKKKELKPGNLIHLGGVSCLIWWSFVSIVCTIKIGTLPITNIVFSKPQNFFQNIFKSIPRHSDLQI